MRDHGFLRATPNLTVDEVLAHTQQPDAIVAMQPDESVGEAIARMASHGISQLPVMEDKNVIGSVSENSILTRLIAQPAVRDKPVRDIMDAPFPIVPRSLHLDHLSAFLEHGTGAVLVHPRNGEGYQIITKTDLITALAASARP